MKRTVLRLMILLAAVLLIHQVLQADSDACNIAVVSAKASATGRPFIWKNRDHANSYRHEVLWCRAENNDVGGSVRLMGETSFSSGVAICTGGANESGFAITNTTCIDGDNDPMDMANVNTDLMERALEQCKTLAQFEQLVKNFDTSGITVSGIFAVIDACGGAAIYEMWNDGIGKDIMWRKYDVDTAVVTDENGVVFTDLVSASDPYLYMQTTGFVNRTNSNHGRGWIQIDSDDPREIRARRLLLDWKKNNELSPRVIMRLLSKDVLGGKPSEYCTTDFVKNNWNYSAGENWDNVADTYLKPNYNGELFTRYAISRYQTSMGLVIEGAATEEEAKLTTMWVSQCEPALSVFIPYFPYAQDVSKYAYFDTHENGSSSYFWDGVSTATNSKKNSFLNLMFDCVQANPFSSSYYPELDTVYDNISLYVNNGSGNFYDVSTRNNGGGYYIGLLKIGNKMDNTIDYPRLLALQEWTFPLEDIVFRNAYLLISGLRADLAELTDAELRALLKDFSEYCNAFVYKNYSQQSSGNKSPWSFTLPDFILEQLPDGELPDGYNDPDNEDPYPGDDDYDGEGDYSDPGTLVKKNPSSASGGCGMSVFASGSRINSADRMSGFVSLMVTMLFPLCLIMMHRACRKRRD